MSMHYQCSAAKQLTAPKNYPDMSPSILRCLGEVANQALPGEQIYRRNASTVREIFCDEGFQIRNATIQPVRLLGSAEAVLALAWGRVEDGAREIEASAVICVQLPALIYAPRKATSPAIPRDGRCDVEALLAVIIAVVDDELAVEPEDVFSKDFKSFFAKCSNCTQIAANQLQKLDWIFEQCKDTYGDFTKLLNSLKS
ncbi:hypothetical protein T265_03249 [Opisthorchis viverrini]|uniref:Uncharacterized protein n=1 Tax=Opisthorchis viverrini TaxID=6198 RepID=A0A074ZT62_OPIVI|nr:hypothetical protein T265_03249 [Opisthorchis viverrini]KER30301.1 hypothetical protein T265_03249 [Opisthorchis viverrini]